MDKQIKECDWAELSTLRTLQEPQEAMPKLVDLLEYLAKPEQEHMWVLLDVKTDDDPHELLRQMATTIASTPAGKRPWTERIMLGLWTVSSFFASLPLMHDDERCNTKSVSSLNMSNSPSRSSPNSQQAS